VITQRVFERVRRLELDAGVEPSHLDRKSPEATVESLPLRGRRG
jgi:hypothetical protein